VTRVGAVDVDYPRGGGARAAVVVATDRTFRSIVEERVMWVDAVEPYESGQLFRRELPPVRRALASVAVLDLVVVDSYVDLDPLGTPGLGRHVHEELGIPVIGVAKTRYRSATHAAEVLRGGATRPLYVTSVGLPLAEAVAAVSTMDGPYRIPRALRRVDALARGRVTPTSTT